MATTSKAGGKQRVAYFYDSDIGNVCAGRRSPARAMQGRSDQCLCRAALTNA
jgi:hypothetical protein